MTRKDPWMQGIAATAQCPECSEEHWIRWAAVCNDVQADPDTWRQMLTTRPRTFSVGVDCPACNVRFSVEVNAKKALWTRVARRVPMKGTPVPKT